MSQGSKPSIVIPHHIDRWRLPIASKMREVVQRIPEINFYSFSSPQTEEDLILGRSFWELEHIHRCRKASLLLRSFDAVHHASATPANIAASLIAKARGGGRTIHVYTASVEPHRADPYWREFAWSINHCQFLIAGSNNAARVIESSFGRTADLVLPNGVDHEFFNPSEAGEEVLAKVGRTPFVLFVGALLPRKRVDLLIRIAARMSWMHFVVVGRLSSKTNGRKTVELIDQQPNIQFLGFQPKWFVRDLMAHASVLVFPSDLEGYSNVLLEASAMGLPILARPVSSMPEIVQDGLNGWLLPDEPIGEWLARISEIAGWSKQQRRAFQSDVRMWSKRQFSWDSIAYKLRDFYLSNVA